MNIKTQLNETEGLGAASAVERRVMGHGAADCLERCKRLHPHCTLQLARSIAPDSLWHWSVTMPDGHGYAVKGGMNFDDALISMQTDGVFHLRAADALWRMHHNVQDNQPPRLAD